METMSISDAGTIHYGEGEWKTGPQLSPNAGPRRNQHTHTFHSNSLQMIISVRIHTQNFVNASCRSCEDRALRHLIYRCRVFMGVELIKLIQREERRS